MKGNKPVVLVADQNSDDRLLLTRYLLKSNFHVQEATNIETICQAIINFRPDLLILPVRMTPLDGYEICKILRKNTNMQLPFILMLLESMDTKNIYSSIISGADDCVARPDITAENNSYYYITKFIYENIQFQKKKVV